MSELTSRRWTALGSFRQNVRRGICRKGPYEKPLESLAIGGARKVSTKMFARPCLLREQREQKIDKVRSIFGSVDTIAFLLRLDRNCKYPPAKPGALGFGPLKAVGGDADAPP